MLFFLFIKSWREWLGTEREWNDDSLLVKCQTFDKNLNRTAWFTVN